MQEPKDPILFDLVLEAVQEGHKKVQEAVAEGKYIPRYTELTEISSLKNGFPHLRVANFPETRDYGRAISPKDHPLSGPILYADVPSFEHLIDYAVGNKDFRTGVTRPNLPTEVQETWARIAAAHLATEIIDRLMHSFPGEEPTNENILPLYLLLEAPIYEEQLPVDILVPICLTNFPSDSTVKLDDRVSIERMDEPTQLARFPTSWSTTTVSDMVLGAAHYALVLHGWAVPSSAWRSGRYYDVDFYPTEVIEHFFRALHVTTGIPTGYAHIFMRPIGWADGFDWTLPPTIKGPRMRRYPEWLENYGWLRDPWEVSEDECLQIAQVLEKLRQGEPRLELATRRLSSALVRMDETDVIIDLCIALEALMGGDRNEITHKLALRVAAVCVAGGTVPYSGKAIFAAVKRIYSYRSAVVHGGLGAAKYETVTDLEPEPIRTTEAATRLVRAAIQAVLAEERYLDSDVVDAELIANRAGTATHPPQPE